MKPIFEEERIFFKKHTGFELPTDCWRDGSNIYLDPYCNQPLYRFKVENSRIYITKDNSSVFNDYKQVKLSTVIERERERVDNLFNGSVSWTKDFFSQEEYKDIKVVVAYSAGKDSDVLKCVMDKARIDYILNFANTSNDTADTYKHWNEVKKTAPHWHCMNPKEGFYAWIKRKNYFVPSALVRNCCSTFKEGQLGEHYDRKLPLINVTGVRRLESFKRSKYTKIMDRAKREELFGHDSFPKQWITIAPIVEWSDLDVWVYLISHNIKFHQAYRYGFERCGCLICPYQSDYADMLVAEHYSFQWNRWLKDILPISYVNMYVEKSYKWSLEEWLAGAWKGGVSKESKIISLKPTKERIKQLAELKGCTEEVAEKYFKRECRYCKKKLNPNEVAMNLKMFGRNMSVEKMMCKKCMCKELNLTSKEYDEKVIQFRTSGCSLF